jgi:polygalacturonase
MHVSLLMLVLSCAAQATPSTPVRPAFDPRDFGARADGVTDNAAAIQAAIDRAGEAGGDVVLAPSAKPYAIGSGLTIVTDGLRLIGKGATIRFLDSAMGGEVIDCIEIRGTPGDPVEGVTVRGLTIDANYWAQPGSYNPRGIDIDDATGVLIEGVSITDAFVGLTFGRGVTDSEARDCRITRWYDDAFNASGDNESGSCSGIRFVRCIAENSPDERAGGPPGTRNNAWEIEAGAHDIILIDCVVRNCGGNGFAVRNHASDADVSTRNVRFERCVALNVSRNAWSVFGQSWPNSVGDVSLAGCSTDSAAVFYKDIRGLLIRGSSFGGTLTLGPVDGAVIEGSTLAWVRIWATDVGGDQPYSTSVVFRGCEIREPLSVFGDRSRVTVAPPAD